MNITIPKKDLEYGIRLTESVAEKKTTMPILVNLLLTASDGVLKISSTDLEITTVVTLKSEVTSRGSTTVNARVLSDIVKELPDSEVKLELMDNHRLAISTDQTILKVIGTSSDEYPALAGIGLEAKNRISGEILLEMINKTIYAVSQDETRYNLGGVCIEIPKSGKKDAQSTMRMVSTDGHRLSIISRAVNSIKLTDHSDRIVVPKKGLLEIRKMIEANGHSDVGFDVNEGFLVVEVNNSKCAIRLIDCEFPDYSLVLPNSKGHSLKTTAGQFSQAIRRVALLATDKNKCVRFDINPSSVRVFTSSPELGEAYDELTVEYEGPALTVGFNSKYILDFVSSVSNDSEICFEVHGESGPGIFSVSGDEVLYRDHNADAFSLVYHVSIRIRYNLVYR